MTLGSTTPSQFHSEVFRLFDGSDVTKKTKFILSGITSGNVRALTIPDQSGVLSLEGHSHTESEISDLAHYNSSDFDTDFATKSTDDLSESINLYFTNERAQDAVGGILDDGTVGEIVFTYDDVGGIISGVVQDKVDTFLDLSDTPSSYDSADIGKILRLKNDLTGLEFTDSPTFTDVRLNGHGYFGSEVDNGNSGSADTIDWTKGNKQKSVLTDDCTFTFTDPSGPCNLLLKLIHQVSGGATVTWPNNVNWAGGNAPVLSTEINSIDIICFYFDGTDYFGSAFLAISTFLDLSDTPANYTDSSGKLCRVNSAPDAVEFFTVNDLSTDASPDIASDYVMTWDADGSAHKKVKLNLIFPGGTGITGPVSSIDNAIARWDGVDGDTLQNSNLTISDAGLLTTDTEGVAFLGDEYATGEDVWESPLSVSDPDNDWNNESATIDGNENTNATKYFDNYGWQSHYLEFTFPEVSCDKFRVLGYKSADDIKVRGNYYDGSWHVVDIVYLPAAKAWIEFPLGGTRTITKLRLEFDTTNDGNYAYIYEVEYNDFDEVDKSQYKTTLKAGEPHADLTLTLPLVDGAANQALKTNGSGVLSWSGHDDLADFVSGEHFLQTAITNVSTGLSTGLLKVTTGSGALSVITDNSSTWDTHSGTTHDYSFISGNDGATNVTAAELEELSDGSQTTLHSHAGGAVTFLDLTDTPASYDSADIGKVVKVKDDLSGLEFAEESGGPHTIASHSDTTATGAELEELTDGSQTALHSHAGGGATFLDLTDTPSSYDSGDIGKYVRVKNDLTGLEFVAGGGGAFLDLSDTPASYTGEAGKYAKVNATEDAIEFDTPAGGNGYVDRGDPAGYDFIQTALNMDGTWRDLDLSAIVGSNAALVHLRVMIMDSTIGDRIQFRENGNSNVYNIGTCRVQVASIMNDVDIQVVCDSAGKIEYNAVAGISNIWITVAGWILI